MENQWISYIIMAAVIAGLCAINMRNTNRVKLICDKFAIPFVQGYDYIAPEMITQQLVLTESPSDGETPDGATPDGGTPDGGTPDGAAVKCIAPAELQPEQIKQAMLRGCDDEYVQSVARMEQALRECYNVIGTSDHLKKRYYSVLSEIYNVTYKFMQACKDPSSFTGERDIEGIRLYLTNQKYIRSNLAEKLTNNGKAAAFKN